MPQRNRRNDAHWFAILVGALAIACIFLFGAKS